MEITINLLKDTSISYFQIIELIRNSFDERLKQGLKYACSSITEEVFIRESQDGIVLVAQDYLTKELLGLILLHIYDDHKSIKYGYIEYLSVSPAYKHIGIGTKLLNRCEEIILGVHGEYITSDTAVNAKSAVQWHKKNGFEILGLRSYKSTNYYSYYFRKQLKPSKLWNNKIYLALRFTYSMLVTLLTQKKDGSYRKIHLKLKQYIGSLI